MKRGEKWFAEKLRKIFDLEFFGPTHSRYVPPVSRAPAVSGQFTPGQFTPGQFTPGQFTPGRFTPRYTLPLTIDLKIIIRGKLSLGRTIYPGNSRRNNSPWDNLPRDNSPRAIFCLLL